MIFGSTKSRLDHIIEIGCKRIDEAVEGVIDRHEWISPMDNYMKQPIRFNTDVIYIDPMNRSHTLKHDDPMVDIYRQRQAADRAQWEAARSQGDLRRSCAGMAAQKDPMANADWLSRW